MENNKIKVLLIEDNPGDARLIREYLDEAKEAAFHVEHVDCLSKGLSCIAQGGIDAILLDLSLPDSQGLDSLGKILTQTLAVPIVVLSGLRDEAIAIEAVKEGAQDYLVKGNIDSSVLVRSLRYAIERQRLRVALRESEGRYRLLADNIADVIWKADLKGRINYVSPSIKNFLGYTVGEALELEMKDILTPDSAEQAKRLIRDQIALWNPWAQHAPLSLTVEHIRKDGSTLWADVRLSFLCNEKGRITGILGLTRDITDRKRAEEAISESETQYRSLVETASKAGLGITIVQNIKDKEAVFVFVNDEYCKVSGYSREELLGRSSLDTIPPENLASIRERYERRQKGESRPSYYEATLLRKDGTRLPIETSVSVFTYRGKPATVSFFRDITERRKTEEALRKSEERYRLLADNAVDIIWTIDMKGRINYVSPSAKNLFGYSVDEIMAMEMREFLTPASAEIARKVINEEIRMKTAVSQNSYCSLLLEHVRKDGSTFWTEVILSFLRDEHGRITLIQGVTRDITERRKAEEALRESEERYRLLAENVKDIIWTRDMNLKLTYTSPSVSEISGYSVEEVMSMSLEESLTPASIEILRPILSKVVAGEGKWPVDLPETVVLDLDLLHKNGSIVPVEMKVNMLHGSEGRPLGFLGVTRDITERKKAESALRESEAQFRAVFEGTSMGIALVDFNRKALSINLAFERMLGYNMEEFKEIEGSLKYLHPDDAMVDAQLYIEMLKGKREHYTVDKRYIRKDGEVIWGCQNLSVVRDSEGKPKYFVAMVEDITERKRMEEALQKSEEKHRLYFESISDVIYSLDADFTVLSVSPSVERVLGYKCEELVGRKMWALNVVAPEYLELASSDAMRVFNGERIISSEYEFIAKDGTRKFGEVSGAPIFSSEGKVVALISVARDITERKKADEALRESERRLKDAMVLGNSGYWEFDVDMQKLIWADQTFRLFERDPSLGAPSVEEEAAYYSPEQVVKLREYAQRAIEKRESIQYDFVTTLPSGKSAYMIGFMRPVIDSSGKVVKLFGVFHDVTERRRIEDALRQSAQNLRMITDNAEDLIAQLDADLVYRYVSPSYKKMMGYEVEEVLGRNAMQVNQDNIHPDDLEATVSVVSQSLSTLEPGTIQYRIKHKDGHYLWLESTWSYLLGENGEMRGVVILSRDITERKRIEEALRQSEQSYRLLLESTHDSIIVVDAETFKVIFGNRRASLMFGFDPVLHDGVGVNLLDFIHPEDREAAIRGFVEDLYQQERRQRYDVRANTKDGREIWISALGTRIEFKGRVAVLLSLQDVTKDKQIEEEKRRLEEQIQLAGRLAAVGELAAGVAHELNNPIAAIQGFAQLLKGRKDLDTTMNRDLETIYKESQRAAKITQNLLTFARKHEPEKSFISLNEAVEKTLELHTHQMKVNNIELVVELAPDLPKTMADFYQMQQVFMNIINNAEQAMVEAHGKGRFLVQTRRVARMIQVTFTDDGPGISEENLEKVFDPFFTTKEVGKGTGLGLSICYGLIQAHGGRIYAKSKLGEGTTFVVEIPIVSEKRPTSAGDLLAQDSRGVKWKKPKGQY